LTKRIVICLDGTKNTPESDTNVHKFYTAMGPPSGEQVTFYLKGVGTEGSWLRRNISAAIGLGVEKKIRAAYDFVAKNYEPGDEISIVGFSRGAFEARCLASMITNVGLPTHYASNGDRYDSKLSDEIYRAYKKNIWKLDGPLPETFAQHAVSPQKIKMLAVWDTVASIGLSAAHGGIDERHKYLDAEWNHRIQNAFQALSVDERRKEFVPVRWKQGPGDSPYHRMEQVWFPGVHCDVGGGNKGSNLSDAPLSWIIDRAQEQGLTFDQKEIVKYKASDPKNMLDIESYSELWGAPLTREIPRGAKVSETATVRAAFHPNYKPRGPAEGPPEVDAHGADIVTNPPVVPERGDWAQPTRPLEIAPSERDRLNPAKMSVKKGPG
jgi:uncharacterized protein (DUF2235 family)